MDNPKKRKLDGKRIALGQKHEVAYIRKIARKLVTLCDNDIKYGEFKRNYIYFESKNHDVIKIATTSIRRIAKAFLKISNKR